MKRNHVMSRWLVCGSVLGLAVAWGEPVAAHPRASQPPWEPPTVSREALQEPPQVSPGTPQETPADSLSVDSLSADSLSFDTLPVALVEARLALDSVAVLTDTIRAMIEQLEIATVGDQQVLRVRAVEPLTIITELLEGISEYLTTASDPATGVAEIREGTSQAVDWAWGLFWEIAQDHSQTLRRNNERRLEFPMEERGPIHAETQDRSERLVRIREFQLRILVLSESAGVELGSRQTEFDAALMDRAPNLVGQIQLALEDQDLARRELRQAERAGVEGDGLAQATVALEEASNWTRILAEGLTNTADLMDGRGYETAEYRQLVISATGDVSGEILDFDVLWGLAIEYVMSASEWFQEEAADVAIRFLMVLASIMSFKYLFGVVWWVLLKVRVVGKTKATRALGTRLAGPLGSFSGLLLGLYLVGVEATFLAAGVGVVGVILGLALQDTVANLAAGAFVLMRTPYDLDDTVVLGGILGTVSEVGLSTTSVTTFDNRVILVPNKKVLSEVMENRSTQSIRRAEAKVSAAYEDDLERITPSVLEMLGGVEKILADPEPEVYVSSLADSGVELTVRCWTPAEDWWDLQMELPGLLWSHFQKNGIEIPYPRRYIIAGDGVDSEEQDSGSNPPSE
jgi:small conductance mechanosensitive channel